jgi:hypothetical protein
MGSGAMMYIQSFIKTGSGIQKLVGEERQTNRQHYDLIRTLLFFQDKNITPNGNNKIIITTL